jgi:hypothetical protein
VRLVAAAFFLRWHGASPAVSRSLVLSSTLYGTHSTAVNGRAQCQKAESKKEVSVKLSELAEAKHLR